MSNEQTRTMDVYTVDTNAKTRVNNDDGTYSIIIPTGWSRSVTDQDGNPRTERVYIQQDHGTTEQIERRRKTLGIPDSQWNYKDIITTILREVR